MSGNGTGSEISRQVARLSRDFLTLEPEAVNGAIALGIPAVALFPATEPEKKSAECEEAINSRRVGVSIP